MSGPDARPAPEDCPEPFWHETHRYCPVCTWTEPREGTTVIAIFFCDKCGHLVFQDQTFVKEGQLDRDPPTPPLWGPTGACRMCGQGHYFLWGLGSLPNVATAGPKEGDKT